MPSVSLLIFDMDGVLVDSEEIANRAFVDHLATHGIVMPLEEASREFTGRTLSDCIALAESRSGCRLPPDFADTLQRETFLRFAAELEPVPHVRKTLDTLHYARCVASSSAPDKISLSLSLTGLATYFRKDIFSGVDVARGKPAPDLFLHASRAMNVDPSECVVIEDSRPGVEAALAAGMRVFGFAGCRTEAAPALASFGVPVFVDMRQLPALLRDGAM